MMVGFDNPWYAEMIERWRAGPQDSKEERSADIVATALLAAASIIGTALDGVADAIKKRESE